MEVKKSFIGSLAAKGKRKFVSVAEETTEAAEDAAERKEAKRQAAESKPKADEPKEDEEKDGDKFWTAEELHRRWPEDWAHIHI